MHLCEIRGARHVDRPLALHRPVVRKPLDRSVQTAAVDVLACSDSVELLAVVEDARADRREADAFRFRIEASQDEKFCCADHGIGK